MSQFSAARHISALSIAVKDDFFSADSMKDGEALLVDCQRNLVDFEVSYRGPNPLLDQSVDRHKVDSGSKAYLEECVRRWSAYLDLLKKRSAAGLKGPGSETTSAVCAMLTLSSRQCR